MARKHLDEIIKLKQEAVNKEIGAAAETPIISSRKIHIANEDEVESNIDQYDHIEVAVDTREKWNRCIFVLNIIITIISTVTTCIVIRKLKHKD